MDAEFIRLVEKFTRYRYVDNSFKIDHKYNFEAVTVLLNKIQTMDDLIKAIIRYHSLVQKYQKLL